MTSSRSYSDACGMAHGLDLVGQRWALHVVRELLLGAKRYTDLKADLPGISTNMLGDRLAELERTGLVRRRQLPPPAAAKVYELTDYGRDLEPVICGLGRWAARSPGHRPDLPLSVTSFVLSLRTNVNPDRTKDAPLVLGLRVRDTELCAQVVDGRFRVEPGWPTDPEATLAGEPEALGALVYGGLPLDAAAADGTVQATGDAEVLRTFLGLFGLPEKVSVPDLG